MTYFAAFTVFLVSLMFPALASAFTGEGGRLDCTPGPDSPSFQIIRKDANTFSARMSYPNGINTATVYSGDVTVGSVEALIKRAEYVKSLGGVYAMDIPAKDCIRRNAGDDLFYVHCFSREVTKINGVQIEGISFYARGTKTESVSGATGPIIMDKNTFVGVSIGQRLAPSHVHWYDFSGNYLTEECSINENFWK